MQIGSYTQLSPSTIYQNKKTDKSTQAPQQQITQTQEVRTSTKIEIPMSQAVPPIDLALRSFFEKMHIEELVRRKQSELDNQFAMQGRSPQDPMGSYISFLVASYKESIQQDAKIEQSGEDARRQMAIKMFQESLRSLQNQDSSSFSLVA